MDTKALLEQLIIIKEKNIHITESLDERKKRELEFHDRDRDKEFVQNLPKDVFEQLHGNKKFYSTVEASNQYLDEWIRIHSKGKVFLDYACGNGSIAMTAAASGAALAIGIDISGISVTNAEKAAAQLNLKNTFFLQGDCENTGLPSDSIDAVVCSGVLHHMDLRYAFPELRRVLKPGGVAFALEAPDYNPIIKLYRKITPAMRTEWEKQHILSYRSLKFASDFFEVKNIRHWHLFSIFGVYLPFAKKIFSTFDKIILSIPYINRLSWMFSFELYKPTIL